MTPWEDAFGCFLAVRIGIVVEVRGTIEKDEKGTVYGVADMYNQAAYIICKIKMEAGAMVEDD